MLERFNGVLLMSKNNSHVYIGNESLPIYITAGHWAINKTGKVVLLGRGTNIKTTVDVAEILKRQLVNPKVEVSIGSEDFNGRKVSTIEIKLEGEKIKIEKKE